MTDEQHTKPASPPPDEHDTLEITLGVNLEKETPTAEAGQATEILIVEDGQVTKVLAGATAPSLVAEDAAAVTDLVVEFDEEEPAPAAPAPAATAAEMLEHSADDLLVVEIDEEEDLAAVVGTATADLDLSAMDLSSEPAPIVEKTSAWGDQAPIEAKAPAWGKPLGEGLPGKEEPGKKTAGPTTAAFSFSGVLIMAVAGLLGGLLGWGITEPLQPVLQWFGDLFSLVVQTALYATLAGGAIGIALGIGNGFAVGSAGKGARWAAFGLLWGGLGGAVGGGLAQLIYGALSADYAFAAWAQLLLRAAGWSIMGVFFGLGQSAIVTADKKMRNGLLGGALGGLLGGAAFQLLTVSANGLGGRCLALCAMGLCIGALIGLIEEAAKEAWVRVTGGPLTGKQFILYEERTVIGSSPACSITLFKDPSVAPEHAAIRNNRTEFVIAALLPDAVVLVNGRPTSRRVLEDGDSITIGLTRMEFRERKKDEEHKPRKQMWGKVK